MPGMKKKSLGIMLLLLSLVPTALLIPLSMEARKIPAGIAVLMAMAGVLLMASQSRTGTG